MGVSDTFTVLAGLPVEHRLLYVEAAIREPFTELQSAALDALSDPEGLNRPDLVIQHFFDLTADVRQRVVARSAQFIDAARQELRSTKEWSRRAAYHVLAVLQPREAASVLGRGLSDLSVVVRDSVPTLSRRWRTATTTTSSRPGCTATPRAAASSRRTGPR
jgi:hypothetical protein